MRLHLNAKIIPKNLVFINNKRQGKSFIGELKGTDNQGIETLITTDEGKILGSFFSSVFTKEVNTTYNTQDIQGFRCMNLLI